MKVQLKTIVNAVDFGLSLDLCLKQGCTPDIFAYNDCFLSSGLQQGGTRTAIPSNTDIQHWYKTTLFSDLYIDCQQFLVWYKEPAGSAPTDSNSSEPMANTNQAPKWISLDSVGIETKLFYSLHDALLKRKSRKFSEESEREIIRIIHCYILPELRVTKQHCDVLAMAIRDQQSYISLSDRKISRLMDNIISNQNKLAHLRCNVIANILATDTELKKYTHLFLRTLLEHIQTEHETTCRNLLFHHYDRTLLEQSLVKMNCQTPTGYTKQIARSPLERSVKSVVQDLAGYGLSGLPALAETRHNDVSYSHWRVNLCKVEHCDCRGIYDSLSKISKVIREEIDKSVKLVQCREQIVKVLGQNGNQKKHKVRFKLRLKSKHKRNKVFSSTTSDFEYLQLHGTVCRNMKEIEALIWDKSRQEMILHILFLEQAMLGDSVTVGLRKSISFPWSDACSEWRPPDEQVKHLVQLDSLLRREVDDCVAYTRAQCQILQQYEHSTTEKEPTDSAISVKHSKQEEASATGEKRLQSSFKRFYENPVLDRPGVTDEPNGGTASRAIARAIQNGVTSSGQFTLTPEWIQKELNQSHKLAFNPSGTLSKKTSTLTFRPPSYVCFEQCEDTGQFEVVCDASEAYVEIAHAKLVSTLVHHFNSMIGKIELKLSDHLLSRTRIWKGYEEQIIPLLMPFLLPAYASIFSRTLSVISKSFGNISRDDLDLESTVVDVIFKDADNTRPRTILRKQSSRGCGKKRRAVLYSDSSDDEHNSASGSAGTCTSEDMDKRPTHETAPTYMRNNRLSVLQIAWVSQTDSWRKCASSDSDSDDETDSDREQQKSAVLKTGGPSPLPAVQRPRTLSAGAEDMASPQTSEHTGSEDKNAAQCGINIPSRDKFDPVYEIFEKIAGDSSLTSKMKLFVVSLETITEVVTDMCKTQGKEKDIGSDELLNILVIILCTSSKDLFKALYLNLEIILDLTDGFVNDMGMSYFVLVTYKTAISYIIEKCQESKDKNSRTSNA